MTLPPLRLRSDDPINATAALIQPVHRNHPSVSLKLHWVLSVLLSGSALLAPGFARAGIQFENCVGTADGAITCDTAPTGDTALDAAAAQAGLFNQASPGWSEFDPYQGYAEDLGDTED